MLTFEQIEELIEAGEPLPKYATTEERCAYHEMKTAQDLYSRCLIDKPERDEIRADAWHTFHDLRNTRMKLRAGYERHQEGIKRAEEKLSQLIKAAKNGENAEKLLGDAFEVISLLEGQQVNSYAHVMKARAESEVA